VKAWNSWGGRDGTRAGSLRAGRSNTFKGLCAVRICLGVLRASLPKCSSARSVLRALHLHLPNDGTTLFARRRRGGARGRALAKARRSPVRSTTSSAPLSASGTHRVRIGADTQMGVRRPPSRLLREMRRLRRPGARSGRALEDALGRRLSCARAALGLRVGCAWSCSKKSWRDGREATRWRRERAARGLLRSCASRCA